MALLDQHTDSSFGIAGQFRRRRRWHLSLVAVASAIALAVLVALRSDHRNYVLGWSERMCCPSRRIAVSGAVRVATEPSASAWPWKTAHDVTCAWRRRLPNKRLQLTGAHTGERPCGPERRPAVDRRIRKACAFRPQLMRRVVRRTAQKERANLDAEVRSP